MEKWDGLVAIVTGASSGIGEAIAVKLAEQGMQVAALARREDRLKALSEKFRGKGSLKAYKCDISKEDNIEQAFRQVEKDLGKIRVLVNNAGVGFNTKLTDFCMDKWKQMYDLNVFGTFTCIKQIVHAAKEDNEKPLIHIININSIAGHIDPVSDAACIYAASKHTVTFLNKLLLKQLAHENLKNIRMTSLSPGLVKTELFEAGGWTEYDVNKMAHLSPVDIANGVIAAISAPEGVVISELTIKPSGELY